MSVVDIIGVAGWLGVGVFALVEGRYEHLGIYLGLAGLWLRLGSH